MKKVNHDSNIFPRQVLPVEFDFPPLFWTPCIFDGIIIVFLPCGGGISQVFSCLEAADQNIYYVLDFSRGTLGQLCNVLWFS